MKILVAYMSQTGNTRKVAQAIFEETGDDGEIKSLDDIERIEGYELVFIGFPIQAFGPAEQARKFLNRHVTERQIALFVTHAVPEDHPELPGWLAKCREAADGAQIINLFDCQGELGKEITEFLKKSDDPKMRAFGEQGAQTIGQPDEIRIERARRFARETIKMVKEGGM